MWQKRKDLEFNYLQNLYAAHLPDELGGSQIVKTYIEK